MKKYVKVLIILILHIVIVAGILYIAFYTDLLNKNENTSTDSNDIPEEIELNYHRILEVEFDSIDDTNWLNFFGEPKDYQIENGLYPLKQESGLKYEIDKDNLVHIRAKQPKLKGDQNNCFCIHVNMLGTGNSEVFALNIINKDIMYLEVHTSIGFYHVQLDGTAFFPKDKWVDIIIYINELGDELTFIVVDTENSADISYISLKLPESWQGNKYDIVMFEHAWEGRQDQGQTIVLDQYSSLDFIRVYKGSLVKYLEENVPTYNANKDMVDEYLASPHEVIDLDKFMEYDWSPEEEQQSDEENDNEDNFDVYDSNEFNGDAGPYWSINVGNNFDIISDMAWQDIVPQDINADSDMFIGYKLNDLMEMAGHASDRVSVTFAEQEIENCEIEPTYNAYIVFKQNGSFLGGPFLLTQEGLWEYPVIEIQPN